MPLFRGEFHSRSCGFYQIYERQKMKNTFSVRLLTGVSLMAVLASQINVSNAQTVDNDVIINEDTIVVTAGRREQHIADVQASIQVINKDQIQTFSGASVTEALRQSVGLDARSSGANSTVSVRGQIPNAGSAVLVLFDGLPRTGKFGLVNLNNFPIEDVERVEIIRGPMSALYGANASGGVINVITKPAGEGAPVSIRATTGTSASKHGEGRTTYNLGASLNLMSGKVGHRASIDYRNADPYRFDDSVDVDDLSGIKHVSLTYSGQMSTSETSELKWTLEAFDQDDRGAGMTRSRMAFERIEQENRYYGALAWNGDVGPGMLELEASYGDSDGRVNRSYPGPDEVTKYNQTVVQGRYHLSIDDNNLLIGGGVQRDEIDVSILSQVGSETNKFAYFQDEWDITGDIRLSAGVRYDNFKSFGNQVEPRVSIGSRGEGFIWRLGYGEAFRAPSVLEQFASFNRGRFLIVGVADINPEETKTKELAIGWRGDKGNIEVIYHNSDISNLIQAAPNGTFQNGLMVMAYQNIAKASISGVEVVGTYEMMEGLTLSGSYEYLDAIDSDTDVRLNGRAKHTVRTTASYEIGPWTGTVRAKYVGSLMGIDPYDRARPAFTSDYTTFDMQAQYQFNEVLRIAVGLDNIADKRVPLNWSSTAQIEDPAGRFAYLTLGYSFGGQ